MHNICHIRGEPNYWEKPLDVSRFFNEKNSHGLAFVDTHILFIHKVIKFWDRYLKIPYFEFRKQIRDIAIENIISFNFFDKILYNNEECEEYILNTTNNFLFFQQDDDDILVSIPEKTTPGINVYKFAQLCPRKFGKFTQKFKYDLQEEYYIRPHHSNFYNRLHSIDTNHVILDNSTNLFDFKKQKIWNKSHLWYNSLLEQSIPTTYHDTNFSLHIINISSITSWKNGEKKEDLTEKKFIKCIETYIHRLEKTKSYIPKKIYDLHIKLL